MTKLEFDDEGSRLVEEFNTSGRGVAMTQFQPKWPGEPKAEALGTGAGAVERARSIAGRVRSSG